MKYKIEIAYQGTNYHGWQIQPGDDTVQERIEKALFLFTREEKIKVVGAGRTDSGVHAKGQVAHFILDKELQENAFLKSMQALLPQDIRILSLEKVADSFHAQRSPSIKTYRYYFYLDKIDNPFYRFFHWHIPFSLDKEKMQETAKLLIGKKDFSCFANESKKGAVSKNPVRTLFSAHFIEKGPLFIFEVTGDGFFYKMVRNIVGTLYDIGRGKLPSSAFLEILNEKDRKKAGLAAPSHGLFLEKVRYLSS